MVEGRDEGLYEEGKLGAHQAKRKAMIYLDVRENISESENAMKSN